MPSMKIVVTTLAGTLMTAALLILSLIGEYATTRLRGQGVVS